MNSLDFSIVIPIYNQEAYLKQCLESIFTQSYSSYEVILIDDGSTDKSPSICLEYASKYKQIKYRKYTNAGLGEARNRGINESIGKYIIFIDCDDKVDSDLLLDLSEHIESNYDFINYGLAFSRKDTIIKKFSVPEPLEMNGSSIFENSLVDNLIITSSCNKAYSRAFLNSYNIRFGALRRYEDIFFTRVCSFYSEKIKFLPGKIYYYADVREGSNMRSFDKNVINQINDLFKAEDDFFVTKLYTSKQKTLYELHKIKLLLFLVFSAGFRSRSYSDFRLYIQETRLILDKIHLPIIKLLIHLPLKHLFILILTSNARLFFLLTSILRRLNKVPY